MLPTSLAEKISNNLLSSRELILSTLPDTNIITIKKLYIFYVRYVPILFHAFHLFINGRT